MFRGCLSNKEINCKTRKLQKKRKQNKITHKLGEIIYLIWGEITLIFKKKFGFSSSSGHVSKLDWRKGEACHVSSAEWRNGAGDGQSRGQLSRAEKDSGWHAIARDPREEGLGRALTDSWKERALWWAACRWRAGRETERGEGRGFLRWHTGEAETRADVYVRETRALRPCVQVTRARKSEEMWESWTVGPTRMMHLAGSASGLIGSALSLMAWLRMVENMAFMAYFCVTFYTAFYL